MDIGYLSYYEALSNFIPIKPQIMLWNACSPESMAIKIVYEIWMDCEAYVLMMSHHDSHRVLNSSKSKRPSLDAHI